MKTKKELDRPAAAGWSFQARLLSRTRFQFAHHHRQSHLLHPPLLDLLVLSAQLSSMSVQSSSGHPRFQKWSGLNQCHLTTSLLPLRSLLFLEANVALLLRLRIQSRLIIMGIITLISSIFSKGNSGSQRLNVFTSMSILVSSSSTSSAERTPQTIDESDDWSTGCIADTKTTPRPDCEACQGTVRKSPIDRHHKSTSGRSRTRCLTDDMLQEMNDVPACCSLLKRVGWTPTVNDGLSLSTSTVIG